MMINQIMANFVLTFLWTGLVAAALYLAID